MKIILGEFKDNGDELAGFLESRVGVKPKPSGDGLEIDDDSVRKGVKPRHVKTYLKRFLLKKGERRHYKVLVEGGELTMVYLEREGEEREEKKREEVKAKPEEKPKAEQPGPPQAEQEAKDQEAKDKVKEEAASDRTEEKKPEEAAKQEAPKKQRKPRKKSA